MRNHTPFQEDHMSNNFVKKSNDIIIDDSSKIYNIKNKQGKLLGKFEFRPSDTNIVKRYEEVVDYFNNLKLPEDSDQAIQLAEKEVIEKISYLINSDAQNTFFNILGPFSPLETGELFAEQVLKSVANVIEHELSVRTKKVQRRMNKYVEKYHR